MKIKRINIGEKVREKVKERGISVASFAKSIGIQRQNIESTIFGKNSIDTEKLALISEQLNFNFFQYYMDSVDRDEKHYNSNEIKEIKASITLQIGAEKQEETFSLFFGKKQQH
jgi:transcriptional regulator with XRE-family HTH domain